jgi:hypothetical protein
MMRSKLLFAATLFIAGCTSAQVQQAQSNANNAVAAAQPTIEMACWLVQAAAAGFAIYAESEGADPTVVANEMTAINAANVTCADPPSDLAQAIADVMATYKAVVAATPDTVPAGT